MTYQVEMTLETSYPEHRIAHATRLGRNARRVARREADFTEVRVRGDKWVEFTFTWLSDGEDESNRIHDTLAGHFHDYDGFTINETLLASD